MGAESGKTYDVGILGWWYGKNYGSILTYYGLNRAIEGLGHKVLMVNETLGYNGFRVQWPPDILSIKFARRVGYEFTEQRHFSQMAQLNEDVATFVVGSDQLWNPLIGRVNDDLFLDFVGPDNRRVAYATSFGNRGTAKFKPDFIEKHSANLKKFAAISVRESYAVDTARDVFGVEATQVVDPVFLLPRKDYETLAAQATVKAGGDYLAVFFLDPTPEKKAAALAVADRLGLARIMVIPNPDGGKKLSRQLFTEDRFEILSEDSPENFLWTYSKARYVVTDSFHGTAFAVIFGKPFSSIYNTHRGADRFKSLLDALGFGESRRILETEIDRTITQNPDVSFQIDFTKADAYIRTGREQSLNWLRAALPKPARRRGTGIARKGGQLLRPQMAMLRGALASLRHSTTAQRLKKAAGFAWRKARYEIADKKSEQVALNFRGNNTAWTVTPQAGGVDLRVADGAGKKGNLVWCDISKKINPNQKYRIEIDWELRTAANVVTIHLRNGATGKFVPAGHIAVGEKRGIRRTDLVDFTVKQAGLNQIMLGASQFLGTKPAAMIHAISIRDVTFEKEYVEPAIPIKTRDLSGILAEIQASEQIRGWHGLLERAVPGVPVHVARCLKEHTHNRVGGPADLLAFPTSADQVAQLVETAHAHDIPVTILGLCTNILVRDGGIRGLVISMTGLAGMRIDKDVLTVGAGAGLTETAFYLLDHGKSCLEWAAGIPGTVGGAIYMNAGTNVSDIRRSIETITFIDETRQVRTIGVADVSWGKRHSTFQENKKLVILEATFRVRDGNAAAMREQMVGTVEKRARHFPLDLPNHGSTFKWWRAPRLVSQAGLTGYRIGQVQISTKQPGFMVNLGDATASDYEALINYTIARVYEYSGFLMEPEVEIIGERLHRYERYLVASAAAEAKNLDDR